jgi:hypothetical protein
MSESSEHAFQDARRACREVLRTSWRRPTLIQQEDRGAGVGSGGASQAGEAAAADGFQWPGARSGAKPPYELQPGTGRYGADKLWALFDEALAELDRVSEGRSVRAVGRAS